jgi:ATP-dependent Zn protease
MTEFGNDLRSTAIHQAGHAVIGRALGMVMGEASIVPDVDAGSAGHSAGSDQWVTWEAWTERGKFRDIDSVYRGHVMELMAGREAELECIGHCQGGDGEDQYQIAVVLDSLVGHLDDEALLLYAARLRARTRWLVRRHRDAIERVAAALLERRTLAAQDI